MTPELFRSRPGAPALAGAALAKLHRSGQSFEFLFELFSMIDEYLALLFTKDVDLPEGYNDIVAAADPVRGNLGHDPTAAEQGRIVIYKAMCDLLWTLWGLIQHADGNPAEDFWAYSTGRFDR